MHGKTQTSRTKTVESDIKTSKSEPDLKVGSSTNWWRLKECMKSISLTLPTFESGPSKLQFKSPAMRMGSADIKSTRCSWDSRQSKSADRWVMVGRGGLYAVHKVNLRPRLSDTESHRVSSLHVLQLHTDWSLFTFSPSLHSTATPPYPLPSERSARDRTYPGKLTYREEVSGFSQVSVKMQTSQLKWLRSWLRYCLFLLQESC